MINGIGCTIISVFDNEQGSYFLGSNSDNPWDAKTKVCIRKGKQYRFIGTELVCLDEHLPWSNMITRGVNEEGIAYTFSYVECSDEVKSTANIKFKGFGEHILGNFSTLESIHQYLQQANDLPHGNFLFADAEGNSLVCELHPNEKLFEWNPKEPVMKTNHYTKLIYCEDSYVQLSNSKSRYQGGLEELNGINFESSTVMGLKKFLRNHRNEHQNKVWGGSTCNHGSEAGTVSSEILDTKNRILWYCFGNPCGNSEKLDSWGKYIPFHLSDSAFESDLTTTDGKIINHDFILEEYRT